MSYVSELEQLITDKIVPFLESNRESQREYRDKVSWERDHKNRTSLEYAQQMLDGAKIDYELEEPLSKENLGKYIIEMWEKSETIEDPVLQEQFRIGAAKLVALLELDDGRYEQKIDPYSPKKK